MEDQRRQPWSMPSGSSQPHNGGKQGSSVLNTMIGKLGTCRQFPGAAPIPDSRVTKGCPEEGCLPSVLDAERMTALG